MPLLSYVGLLWLLAGAAAGLTAADTTLVQRAGTEQHVSIRNELETALANAEAYLAKHPSSDSKLPFPKRATALSNVRAFSILVCTPSLSKLDYDSIEPAFDDLVQQMSAKRPSRNKAAAVAYMQAYYTLHYSSFQEFMGKEKLPKAAEAPYTQNKAKRSPSYGGLEVQGEPLDLSEMIPAIFLAPGVGQGAKVDDVLAKLYLRRCQANSGPLVGSFSPYPPAVREPQKDLSSYFLSTAAGLQVWGALGGLPKEEGLVASAIAWFISHDKELHRQPYRTLQQVHAGLLRAQSDHLPQAAEAFWKWQRLWAERLINEQNGDGSWSGKAGEKEQDVVEVTLQAIELLKQLHALL